MRVDDLDKYSRDFYERALFKRCLSLIFAAAVRELLFFSLGLKAAGICTLALNHIFADPIQEQLQLWSM